MSQGSTLARKLLVADKLLPDASGSAATLGLESSSEGHSFVRLLREKEASPLLDFTETPGNPVYLVQRCTNNQTLYTYFCSRPSVAATSDVVDPKVDPKVTTLAERFQELAMPDEDDWTRPTEYSLSNAVRLVTAAYTLMALDDPLRYRAIPDPILTTDSLGGVRVAWRTGQREVRVNFGAEPNLRTYLYFESRERYGTQDLNPRAFSDRLRWLVES